MGDPTYVSDRLEELPVIFQGPKGREWAAAMGAVQDAEVQGPLRTAALSRLPQYCPDDALDAVGGWFRLPRFPGEPDGTADPPTGYRGRLCQAWPTWIAAGSKQAIISSLNGYGLPDVVVLNDYEISPPYPGAWWSRFQVKIGPSFGAFGWGIGNDPTAEQQHQIAGQILFWKWAYSYPVEVLFDDGAGYTFSFTIGPLLDYGFILDYSILDGYNPI